jgi:hypothetical protein
MESTEHRYIGNQVRVPGGLGLLPAPDGVVQLELSAPGVSTVTLSYGAIVALGGDFYGTPDYQPISSGKSPEEQMVLFNSAHATLVGGNRWELTKIGSILDYQSSKVLGSDHPAAAFAALRNDLDYQWNEATGGAPASDGLIGMATKPGRYTLLAMNNLDHFGADAMAAYRAGHQAACDMASQDLNAALAKNAHADHFLSDLFAGGHIRTPRRVLHEFDWNMADAFPNGRATIGGLLSKAMHDEENTRGLTVTSQAYPDQSWVAFGDCQILEARSAENAQHAVRALQVSVDEVIAAKSNPGQPAFKALDHVPYVAGAYPPTGGPSIAPMLVAEDREPLERSGSYEFLGQRIPTPGLGSWHDYFYTGVFLWQSLIAETLGVKFVEDLPNQIFVWLGK